jgi:hypothetical protein
MAKLSEPGKELRERIRNFNKDPTFENYIRLRATTDKVGFTLCEAIPNWIHPHCDSRCPVFKAEFTELLCYNEALGSYEEEVEYSGLPGAVKFWDEKKGVLLTTLIQFSLLFK